MTRLAQDRDTHLTPEEIAAEALRQLDADGDEPSIRSLAAALKVAPSAIYHHFSSRAEILQAAVELVWLEATAELLELVPQPLEAEPRKVLVASGIATRRAWFRHNRLAPYMAASPEPTEFTLNALRLMQSLFERMGFDGERALAAFHSYASFMIGAVIFGAARKTADEQLGRSADNARDGRFGSQPIERAMDVSLTDPALDEELFARSLRHLVESY